METNYIREFIVLANVLNYQEAAEQLFISQPSLSKHIQVLEKDLNFLLFNRSTRKIALTKNGQLFLPHAIKIIESEDQAIADLQANALKKRMTVSMGCIPAMEQYNLISLIYSYEAAFPTEHIHLHEIDPRNLKKGLRQKQYEIAFIQEPYEMVAEDDDLIKLPYYTDILAAVLPKDHPYAKLSNLSLDFLAKEELLLPQEKTFLYNVCIKLFSSKNIQPSIKFTSLRFSNIMEMSKNRIGIGLVLKRQALYENMDSVVLIPIEPLTKMHVSLCYMKNTSLSDNAKRFIQWYRVNYEKYSTEPGDA